MPTNVIEVICQCANCSWQGPESKLGRPLEDCPLLAVRLDPGGVVPAGECPRCNCFAYLVEAPKIAHAPNTTVAEWLPYYVAAARGRRTAKGLAKDDELLSKLRPLWSGIPKDQIVGALRECNLGGQHLSWQDTDELVSAATQFIGHTQDVVKLLSFLDRVQRLA